MLLKSNEYVYVTTKSGNTYCYFEVVKGVRYLYKGVYKGRVTTDWKGDKMPQRCINEKGDQKMSSPISSISLLKDTAVIEPISL